jgi:alkanesulfonate monooxygenase SsuD/methylene tetrahydromethanopterin reductase-like flavin-dependent oxidoreductase (luciferase family)
MEVGLFDHIGRADQQLSKLFDDRISFYSAADKLGFYCMHLAEHHCSPVNMAPSPSVFLAALARETKSIRLGPLCYLLTLYTPLRLLEEIAMLDHLSHGRLEVGIGRGVSPFELSYHNVDHSKSRDIFLDAYQCIREGMITNELTYEGDFYRYEKAPIELHPYQKTPAFWYGSSNTVGATFAGEHGMHFTANGPTDFAKKNIDAYKEALAKRGAPEVSKPEFKGGAAIGALRQIYVAETDAEANAIAEPAALKHHEEINWLRNKHGVNELTARLNVPRAHDFRGMIQEGTVIAGSPSTVLAEIERQTEILGTNYILGYMMFGSLTLNQALRSLNLFSAEVMPKLKAM